MFPPGTVPLGLNHPGAVPLGHYPVGQIPFLFPPSGIFFVPIMSSTVLPNMTFGIPIWYIDPHTSTLPGQLRPYHALTLVQPIPATLSTTLILLQAKQEPTPIAKVS